MKKSQVSTIFQLGFLAENALKKLNIYLLHMLEIGIATSPSHGTCPQPKGRSYDRSARPSNKPLRRDCPDFARSETDMSSSAKEI